MVKNGKRDTCIKYRISYAGYQYLLKKIRNKYTRWRTSGEATAKNASLTCSSRLILIPVKDLETKVLLEEDIIRKD